MEPIGSILKPQQLAAKQLTEGSLNPAVKQLAANRYQRDVNIQIKQLTADEIKEKIRELPIEINPKYEYAVVGHIQHFGWVKVCRWAQQAASKRAPERWLMSVMSRERYGK
jgi:hypothetical protein